MAHSPNRASPLYAFVFAALVVGICISAPDTLAQDAGVRNAQQRLLNLGFVAGAADGFMGPRTRRALREFQRREGLPETGELDDATSLRLFEDATEAGSRLDDSGPDLTPVAPSVELPSAADIATDDRQPTAPPPAVAQASADAAVGDEARPSVPEVSEQGLRAEPPDVAGALQSEAENAPDGNRLAWLIGAALAVLTVIGLRRRRHGRRPIPPSPAASARREPATEEWTAQPMLSAGPAPREASGVGWIDARGSAQVAGREIGGMVYVGAPPRSRRYGKPENAFIDPNRPVAANGGDFAGSGLSYWPNFSEITPVARATYLDWLAGGRNDRNCNPGYMFLYFYGLERRYFVDEPSRGERLEIIAEVRRLLETYGDNGSVRRYLGAFLDAAPLLIDGGATLEPVFAPQGHEAPLAVRVAVGRRAASGEPLDADWLLSWLMSDPETRLRTPASRCFPEFRVLFRSLFDARYPGGLKLRRPKRALSPIYRAASGTFEVNLDHAAAGALDVSGFSEPLRIAEEIAAEATESLDKLSRYLGRDPEGRGSLEAQALLPRDLWPHFPSAGLEALRGWARELINAGGKVNVEDALARIEGARPDRIGKRSLIGAADTLARLSIGLAPDPRYALRAPRFGEPVILFDLPAGVDALESVSAAYQPTLISLALGAFIAHADGRVAEDERVALARRIDMAEGLTPTERARLAANLDWLIATPPDLSLFRRRLADASEESRREFGMLALAVAGADGAVDPAEIRALERLYGALGLDPGGIHRELHALMASQEPVTLSRPSMRQAGYAIPAPPVPAQPEGSGRASAIRLDAARISAVMADTARVGAVLGGIFSDDPSDDEEDEPEPPAPGDPRFAGLDAAHAAFAAELVTRPRWGDEEFDRLAENFALMPAGALETINEWSYARHDEALIEEYEGYEVNAAVVAALGA